jgi:CheY-like chemotaxis protein
MPIHNILIVEDEIIAALALAADLGSTGFQTELALSGDEAIQCIENGKTDLVLMDINLQAKADGIETAGLIRDRFGMPIVFMTGYNDDKMRTQAERIGCLGYLIKPVSLKNILDLIDAYQAEEAL